MMYMLPLRGNGVRKCGGGPNRGTVIIYDSQGGTNNITNVTVNTNQFVNRRYVAEQFAGNGSENACERINLCRLPADRAMKSVF